MKIKKIIKNTIKVFIALLLAVPAIGGQVYV